MTENLSDTETITVEVSSRGKRLRSPITVNVPRAERLGEKALNQYVIDAFSKKMPSLMIGELKSSRNLIRDSGSPADNGA